MKTFTHLLTTLLLSALLVAISLITPEGQAEAHAGGQPQLINGQAGPFLVSVWSLPNPLVSGDVNFILAVAETQTINGIDEAVVVLDADVELIFTSEDGETIRVDATHQNATNKLFYEAYFELPEAGEWNAVVNVNYEGESGSVPFVASADTPPLNINWTLLGGIALVLLAVGWFIWQARQGNDDEMIPADHKS